MSSQMTQSLHQRVRKLLESEEKFLLALSEKNYYEVREEKRKWLFAQHYNSLLPSQAFLVDEIRLKLTAHYNVLERATFN